MTTFGPQIQSRTLGRYQMHAIQAGGQRLDGGAMFGVVPKPLWERRVPADARNRIQLGMRCLLVEHDEGLVLVDTGLGNKEGEKFREIYGVENAGAESRTWLEDAFVALGHRADDVRLVINTHLHFDHAGGNTWADAAGEIRPTFRNARYVVQGGEYDFATHTNERTSASYFDRNWAPLIATGQLEFLDGEQTVVPGLRVLPTPGHVPFHQSVLIEGGQGETACFLGDVCPTTSHLPLPWIMGYDVEPLATLESKRWLLRRAVDERWLLVFEHDADHTWGYVAHDGKAYHLDESRRDATGGPG